MNDIFCAERSRQCMGSGRKRLSPRKLGQGRACLFGLKTGSHYIVQGQGVAQCLLFACSKEYVRLR